MRAPISIPRLSSAGIEFHCSFGVNIFGGRLGPRFGTAGRKCAMGALRYSRVLILFAISSIRLDSANLTWAAHKPENFSEAMPWR